MSTQHFNDSEFKCKCCGESIHNTELVSVLELVRHRFNSPVVVNSAYRCESHNEAVGGVDNSQHRLGTAADIVVKNVSPTDVYDFLNLVYPNQYGLGKYATFTHVDVRSEKARW